jgi:hypothetical protein
VSDFVRKDLAGSTLSSLESVELFRPPMEALARARYALRNLIKADDFKEARVRSFHGMNREGSVSVLAVRGAIVHNSRSVSMALIPCSKCGRQISTFAKECPACRTPPQISTDPPPLPAEAALAEGADPIVVKLELLIAIALIVVGIAGVVGNKSESGASSVASLATPIPAATAQNFPRAIPVNTPPAFGAASATSASVTYRVVKISQGDYLNVRAGAGSKYPVVMRLEPDTDGIMLGRNRVANAETMWQEIIVNGRSGWVNADYIAPAPQPSASP